MAETKKVMKGLECCAAMSGDDCQKCPYGHECRNVDLPYGMPHLAGDALTLLKKQSEKLKKQAELLKGQKAKYKACSNCSHSKFQAIRGTSCFGYRCKKHRIWGKYGFYCSDWSKRSE